ncbi:hypothetical protein LVY74_12345 [Acinetobacter sp. ME22]|uniref:hypothetical protein n=1 Tax=Acinetobacter sp. ME22 TaxID=2904802 RepID=UPI001EDB16BC|nr:hypothetical protein [Acinetobacter sp. ME22]MCG2574340.1 hypothetical protein [Acinetobacter sp. ME22]
MSLLNLIKKDENFKYISLKEAISLLAEKTNSNLQEVAIYLLNQDIPSELVCNTKGTDYKIKETSGKQFSYGMFRAYGKNWAFEYLTNISEIRDCTTFDELNSVGFWDDWGLTVENGNIGLLENTYWYRQHFFNLDLIKSLNLLDDDQIELNQNLIPIWDANYLNIQELETQSDIELLDGEFLDDLKLIDETSFLEVTPPFLMEETPRKDQPQTKKITPSVQSTTSMSFADFLDKKDDEYISLRDAIDLIHKHIGLNRSVDEAAQFLMLAIGDADTKPNIYKKHSVNGWQFGRMTRPYAFEPRKYVPESEKTMTIQNAVKEDMSKRLGDDLPF